MSAKIHAYIRPHIRFAVKRILTYRAIPFARIEPVALAVRRWSLHDVDVPVLQIVRRSAGIYLPCWIHVNFLYENYAETRVAMTVIPRVTSFPRGRDIFYMCEGVILYIEDRISFLI